MPWLQLCAPFPRPSRALALARPTSCPSCWGHSHSGAQAYLERTLRCSGHSSSRLKEQSNRPQKDGGAVNTREGRTMTEARREQGGARTRVTLPAFPRGPSRMRGVPAASLGTSCGTWQPAVSSWPAAASPGTPPKRLLLLRSLHPAPRPRTTASARRSVELCEDGGGGIRAEPGGGRPQAAAISVARPVPAKTSMRASSFRPLSPQRGSAPGSHRLGHAGGWL